MQLGSWAIVATVVLHGGLAATIAAIPDDQRPEPTVITIRETRRKPPPPPPPAPPPAPAIAAPPAPAPIEQAKKPPPPPPKPRAVSTPAAPAPGAAAPPPDFGVKLGNATGDGPAVGQPKPVADAPPPAQPPAPKTLDTKPAVGGCSEPIVKPKPVNVVQPAFTQAARDAGVTGKVRVEITISAVGAVTAAKLIAGLGHGLDEAALDAARASTFAPATRCGEPVETTFTIGMRFQ